MVPMLCAILTDNASKYSFEQIFCLSHMLLVSIMLYMEIFDKDAKENGISFISIICILLFVAFCISLSYGLCYFISYHLNVIFPIGIWKIMGLIIVLINGFNLLYIDIRKAKLRNTKK